MRRRRFLSQLVQGAALGASTALSRRRVLGANDTVRVGLVGCGVRGMHVAQQMRKVPGVQFVAVCDVYERNASRARTWAGPDCWSYPDFRRILDRGDVDALLVATPDHWHAIPTVLACQAGKDVYVEKPLAHNVREGKAMVAAARRYQRVVQVGTQHRSAAHYGEVRELIQSGALGKVHLVRIWNYVNMSPRGIGKAADSEPPSGLDWDFYLGPAPRVPFNKSRFLGSFRYFWDYAGGYITDWGVHRFDSVHQVMGVDAPRTVAAAGGRFALDDDGQTPDVIQATYEYDGFILSYEGCRLNAHGMGGRTPGKAYYRARGEVDRPHGEAFYGTLGAIFSDRLGYDIYPEPLPDQVSSPPEGRAALARREVTGRDTTDLHVANFIDSVRARQTPAADVEIGHRSTIVAHLGNIAYRTGRKLRWDAVKEEIVDDPQAGALLARHPREPWTMIDHA